MSNPTRPPLVPALLAALALFASSGCIVVGTEAPGGGGDAGPAGEPPAASSEDVPRAMERDIFDRVNDERAERRLPPVAWDDRLAELARDWSREMAGTGQLRHQDLGAALQGGEVEGYASVGENVFSGTGPVTAGRSTKAGCGRRTTGAPSSSPGGTASASVSSAPRTGRSGRRRSSAAREAPTGRRWRVRRLPKSR